MFSTSFVACSTTFQRTKDFFCPDLFSGNIDIKKDHFILNASHVQQQRNAIGMTTRFCGVE